MANSSQSGNILGYASGTQPGLVSTVAQTFAGAKTLDGNAIIKAVASTLVPANYVGEIKTVTNSLYNLSSGAWLAASSGITLSTGSWLVCGSFAFLRNNATIANQEMAIAVVGPTTPATIQSDYAGKYQLRTGCDIQTTGITNSYSVWNQSLPTFFLRSDGTNLYFSDGSTMYAAGQTITFAAYCSAYSLATPQAAGQITAIRLPSGF